MAHPREVRSRMMASLDRHHEPSEKINDFDEYNLTALLTWEAGELLKHRVKPCADQNISDLLIVSSNKIPKSIDLFYFLIIFLSLGKINYFLRSGKKIPYQFSHEFKLKFI